MLKYYKILTEQYNEMSRSYLYMYLNGREAKSIYLYGIMCDTICLNTYKTHYFAQKDVFFHFKLCNFHIHLNFRQQNKNMVYPKSSFFYWNQFCPWNFFQLWSYSAHLWYLYWENVNNHVQSECNHSTWFQLWAIKCVATETVSLLMFDSFLQDLLHFFVFIYLCRKWVLINY